MAGGGFSHVPVDVERVDSKYRKIVTPIPAARKYSLVRKNVCD